ncbi:MAG: hypothetical protein GY913_10955 [Proteobacteria bacterium]|nr:hypothetical protein [Pseudomonadota bacterium]MCP4917432.1 hypothetical protein [Pseudomonadota bacterium]
MSDVAVIGLGTAGAAVAAQCARRGLSVVGYDARPLEAAGARWVNGVPAWAFDAAGFDRPLPPELHGEGLEFHLLAGWGPHRVVCRDHDLMEVDMRHFHSRLIRLAQRHGARLHGETKVTEVPDARFVIDATGLNGLNLLGRPKLEPVDICVAAQEMREVRDQQEARRFFERHEVEPGHTLCFSGMAGGYSIVNLRFDGEHLGILTGSIPGAGHPSGPKLLADWVAENDWVGDTIFGGSRALPLAAPPVDLVRGNVASIGDAAWMTHSAHGSGIAQQMLSSRILAESIVIGDLAEYEYRWLRDYGGILSGMDLFRRFTCSLDEGELVRLMESDALPAGGTRKILTQRLPLMAPSDLMTAIKGLSHVPRLAARFLPVMARLPLLELHHRAIPRGDRTGWERRRRALLRL